MNNTFDKFIIWFNLKPMEPIIKDLYIKALIELAPTKHLQYQAERLFGEELVWEEVSASKNI